MGILHSRFFPHSTSSYNTMMPVLYQYHFIFFPQPFNPYDLLGVPPWSLISNITYSSGNCSLLRVGLRVGSHQLLGVASKCRFATHNLKRKGGPFSLTPASFIYTRECRTQVHQWTNETTWGHNELDQKRVWSGVCFLVLYLILLTQ